jgi:NTE family protein
MKRRTFVTAMTGVAAGAGLTGAGRAFAAPAGGGQPRIVPAFQEALPPAGWDDGLAHPIPYPAPAPGAGKERALVLGGGGLYLIAFYVGYFTELQKLGLDVSNADLIVGTSAGAIGGAMLAGGKIGDLGQELDAFSQFPWLLTKLLPPTKPTTAQLRASQMSVSTKEATPASIQAIGHAAMAANNPDGPDRYLDMVEQVLGFTEWPSPALHTTSNDCYTGERLVVSAESNIPVHVACAASSSLPGQIGPTWLNDRLCMDGGICQTSTHADVAAGAKRALVISLTDGGPEAVEQGLRTSGMPNTLQQEVKDLEAGGTKTMLVVVGLLPGIDKIDSIMDPKYIAPVMAMGQQRASADLEKLKAFWA